MNYIIITPAKNESSYIDRTIRSVTNQSIKPVEWIIVDDGSEDDTYKIVSSYANIYKWIKVVQMNNQNDERSGGSKVVEAFNAGYNAVYNEKYDFIVKLDADLILPSNYFEEIISLFRKDERLGVAGGVILNKVGDKFIEEGANDYHVRGAFKTYRRTCFEDIGGFKSIWNWDGLDEMEALYKGWKAKTIDIKVIHLRPTSSAYNKKKHAMKSGYEAYKLRMWFILMILRCIHKILQEPFFIYSCYYFYGYLKAWYNKETNLIDKNLSYFINMFHIKRLLKLKI